MSPPDAQRPPEGGHHSDQLPGTITPESTGPVSLLDALDAVHREQVAQREILAAIAASLDELSAAVSPGPASRWRSL